MISIITALLDEIWRQEQKSRRSIKILRLHPDDLREFKAEAKPWMIAVTNTGGIQFQGIELQQDIQAKKLKRS